MNSVYNQIYLKTTLKIMNVDALMVIVISTHVMVSHHFKFIIHFIWTDIDESAIMP